MIIDLNKAADINYPMDILRQASTEALDLVIQMTQRNQYNRLTAKECLEHKWFTKNFESALPLKAALQNMKKHGAEYILYCR